MIKLTRCLQETAVWAEPEPGPPSGGKVPEFLLTKQLWASFQILQLWCNSYASGLPVFQLLQLFMAKTAAANQIKGICCSGQVTAGARPGPPGAAPPGGFKAGPAGPSEASVWYPETCLISAHRQNKISQPIDSGTWRAAAALPVNTREEEL